jgi:hypothetical protein
VIRDSEPRPQPRPHGEVAEDFEAEGVQGTSGDTLVHSTPRLTQAGSNFLGSLVGERDGKDSPGGKVEAADEMLYAADQAIRLPRAGTRDYQDRTEWSFDGSALLEGRLEAHGRGRAPIKAPAHSAMASANSLCT